MNKFTQRHQAHLNLIEDTVVALLEPKYRKGVKHHGGHLYDRSLAYLVDNLIDEALDQLVYAITIKQKLEDGNPDK